MFDAELLKQARLEKERAVQAVYKCIRDYQDLNMEHITKQVNRKSKENDLHRLQLYKSCQQVFKNEQEIKIKNIERKFKRISPQKGACELGEHKVLPFRKRIACNPHFEIASSSKFKTARNH